MSTQSIKGRMVVVGLGLSLFIGLLMTPLLSVAAGKMDVRGQRYCEVIFTHTMTRYHIYDTFGLNTCPAEIWKKITLEQIKKETSSSFVHLNGPRYWVIDGVIFSSWVNPNPQTFGGLAMREAGVLNISLLEGIKAKARSNPHYQQWRVQRKTTWIYEAGKPVYELVDPQGTVYVMQSYSIQKRFQTTSSLSSLGSQLTLPAGWQFKTGLLDKQETVQAIDGLATVVQDNFLNTYQMATHDLLARQS